MKTPKFEKRHFEYLARILIEIDSMNFDEMPNPKAQVITTFIEYLKETNANFDADKFREFIYAR
tara:strand:+ start:18759 stop:18950 length:192 start_codon:yes stop_codon:yes gene_type:complete